MTVPFWDNPDGSAKTFLFDIASEASPWDTATLGGFLVPGLVAVEGEPGRKIAVNTSPGSDGATIVDQGFEPAKPTITVVVWTPDQWEDLQSLIARFVPKPGKSPAKPPAALALVHPGANALGITGVLITSVSIPKKGPVVGSRELSIKCVQWVKPKKALLGVPDFNISTAGAVEPNSGPPLPPPSSTNAGP